MGELKDKNWEKALEKPIYEEWKSSKAYKFDPKSKKPVYSIDTPPPYVNAPIHMGHATTYILMDMFARFHRMTGHEVLFPLGLDRNGLPIEVAAEKKFNVTPTSVPREKFIEYCKKLLEEFSTKSTETFLRAGISFSSWKIGNKPGDMYFTDSDEYRTMTQDTFIDLWKQGLIHLDNRVNNYCPKCQTTIADAEIEYKEESTLFNHVKFKVKETGEEIIIGTTRPEFISTCGMIVFNPEDSRYKHLNAKTAVTPIYNKEVPIKPHPYAKIDAGTGLVMMCSFGDYTDIRFFRDEGLKHTIAIDKMGKMNSEAGFLQGLKVPDARKKMIETLKGSDLLVKQEQVQHRQPICERSKTPIEFIDMEEYYLSQLDSLDDIRKVSDKIAFYSERNKQILTDWINSLTMDWALSRRRVYATEIPLWYADGLIALPKKGKYHKPWKEDPPEDADVFDGHKKVGTVKDFPNKKWKGEDRVFDTWFDSSISPLYILKYGEKFFERGFPATLRPQGKEIVRTWLYYTLLRCYQLTKKPVFKDVWIHYHILDGKGHKMSKSLGNVIDPAGLIDRFGAEPVRLWAALEGNLTDADFRCSIDRIESNKKFLAKLWNVSRFCSMFPTKTTVSMKLSNFDNWILDELNELASLCNQKFAEYDFHNPTVKLRHFLWETFASHYIELVKTRAYNEGKKFTGEEQDAAIFTLNYVLDTLLKLMAPILPLITHKIYKDLKGLEIHLEDFPKPAPKKRGIPFMTQDVMELNGKIWNQKKEKGLSLNDPIESAEIPEKFKSVERDLIEAHKIKKIQWV